MIGRLGAPHGVRGWLHVKSYTSPPSNLLDYAPWYVRAAHGAVDWQVVDVIQVRPHGDSFVAHLKGLQDRSEAERWRGREIAVATSEFPPSGQEEVYWHQLVGCQVFNDSGLLGEVVELIETGANDVLVVRRTGRKDDLLVPFADPYIKALDVALKQLRVQWEEDW